MTDLALTSQPAAQSPAQAVAGWSRRRLRQRALVLGALGVLAAVMMVLGAWLGALPIGPAQVFAILLSKAGIETGVEFTAAQEAVLLSIRLPRVVLGMLAGAVLGVGGAAIQGLFRNPLAEPGLIGTSAGAAIGAVIAILGTSLIMGSVPEGLLPWLVPAAAFAGSTIATVAVARLARTGGKIDVATMLLAGIAINALAAAVFGLAMFLADDAELRTITFWTLGSLAGASWSGLGLTAPLMILALLVLPMMARAMNALALGEAEAYHLGVRVEAVRRGTVILVALAVGAAVAVTGIIGFVGLVVPHLLRLLAGPDHRLLIPGSALLGGALLLGADLLARTVAAPAELPLGVVTALLGAPYFLWLLVRQRDRQESFL